MCGDYMGFHHFIQFELKSITGFMSHFTHFQERHIIYLYTYLKVHTYVPKRPKRKHSFWNLTKPIRKRGKIAHFQLLSNHMTDIHTYAGKDFGLCNEMKARPRPQAKLHWTNLARMKESLCWAVSFTVLCLWPCFDWLRLISSPRP